MIEIKAVITENGEISREAQMDWLDMLWLHQGLHWWQREGRERKRDNQEDNWTTIAIGFKNSISNQPTTTNFSRSFLFLSHISCLQLMSLVSSMG